MSLCAFLHVQTWQRIPGGTEAGCIAIAGLSHHAECIRSVQGSAFASLATVPLTTYILSTTDREFLLTAYWAQLTETSYSQHTDHSSLRRLCAQHVVCRTA